MRISVDPDDPGYTNYIAHRQARVFLDGIERNGVFTADEEKRFVIMCVRDERGNLKVKDDMIVREKWTGNVHIEVEPTQDSSVKMHINFGSQPVAGRVLWSTDDDTAESRKNLAQALKRAMRRNS